VALLVTITATRRRTKSAASAGSRSRWSSAQRYSIATLRPSTNPASLSPVRKVSSKSADVPDGLYWRWPHVRHYSGARLVALGLGVLLKILDRPHQPLRVDLPYRVPDFVRFGFTYPGWFCELHSIGFRLISPIQDSCPPPQYRGDSNDELRNQLDGCLPRSRR
jgi:hypothetical protein